MLDNRCFVPWGWVALVLCKIVLRVLVVVGQLRRRGGEREGGKDESEEW